MSIQSGNLEEFLTVAEVAELLKLNQQTVRNWIDQGSLPALRVGRRVRIRRSDLDRMLEEGYTPRAARPSPRDGMAADTTHHSGAHATTGPSAEDFWGGEPTGVVDPWGDDSHAAEGTAVAAPHPPIVS
jgi:excisionase family DNA binding protein